MLSNPVPFLRKVALAEAVSYLILLGIAMPLKYLAGQPLAVKITKEIPIPTIGIGASPACDGQILVMEDMLGLSPRVPKFVKEFGKVGAAIENAIKMYADEVKARTFPGTANTYEMKD